MRYVAMRRGLAATITARRKTSALVAAVILFGLAGCGLGEPAGSPGSAEAPKPAGGNLRAYCVKSYDHSDNFVVFGDPFRPGSPPAEVKKRYDRMVELHTALLELAPQAIRADQQVILESWAAERDDLMKSGWSATLANERMRARLEDFTGAWVTANSNITAFRLQNCQG